jgi:hypothetical protein
MSTSASSSSFEMFNVVQPRLLSRPADIGAVSLLGQAVSDVLDDETSESVLLEMIANLESARASAESKKGNARWALPLAALLGVLRQRVHNRNAAAAALNPGSETLRDKVLGALDADINTPTAIGEYVHSPTTVVSRVLRQLLDEGRVERAAGGEDKRRRVYRRVLDAPDFDEQPEFQAADLPALAARGLADTAQMIEFANELTQTNPRTAATLLPDLMSAGSDVHLDPQLRVSALGVAGVLIRSSGAATAGEDAMDLAETAEAIAERSGDDLLRSRAAYDRARAGLFAAPQHREAYLEDLRRAEDLAKGAGGAAALIRLGWCAYTRCLAEDGREVARAIKRGYEAVELFTEADFAYGRAAALTLVTRACYSNAEWGSASATAQEALALARANGYLRVIAESSFWAAELEEDPMRSQELFAAAGQHFASVGNEDWRALSHASLEVAKADCHKSHLDPDAARQLLAKLRELQDRMSMRDRSWAAAVLTRKIGVCARHAGDFGLATQQLGAAAKIYEAIDDVRGVALAQAGLLASARRHLEVLEQDREDALHGEDSPFDGESVPMAARKAVQLLDEDCSELALAF